MKKINIAFAAIAAMTVLSCNKEMTPSDLTPSADTNLVQKTFYASYGEKTKVAVDKIGETTIDLRWQDGDQVHILTEGQTLGDPATASNVNVGNADFEALVPDGSTQYFAVYPASAVATTDTWITDGDKKALRVTIPAEQQAVHNSFDPKAYVASAVTTNDHLSFKPLVSSIIFELGELAARVEKIVFTVNGSDNVAGSGLLYTDDFTKFVPDGTKASQITLSKPSVGFQSGKNYYINFIPNTCESGITLYVYLNDNTVKKLSSATALFTGDPCGKVKSFGVLPASKMKDVNLYEQYCAGIDVKFGDITVNKATHGEATLITSESASKNLAATGVYFIDPSVTDATISGNAQKLIVSSINNERVKVSKATQVACAATDDIDYCIFANVTFVTGMTSGNVFGASVDKDFETIAFYNVGIEVPKDMNLLYYTGKILNIYMDKCDVKLHEGTAEKNLFQAGNDVTTPFESIVFRNNIIWSCDGDRSAFRFVAAQKCPVTSLEISNNTVAGVYSKAAYGYVTVTSAEAGTIKRNLFLLENYASAVGAYHTGILWLPKDYDDTHLTMQYTFVYYGGTALPSHRLKHAYYTNSGSNLYAKTSTENPVPDPDYANGVFTQDESHKTYGATR